MKRDVKRELMSRRQFIPPQQTPHNDQVSRAGNRNEFSQPLNNGKNNSLIDWQSESVIVSEGWNYAPNVDYWLPCAQARAIEGVIPDRIKFLRGKMQPRG